MTLMACLLNEKAEFLGSITELHLKKPNPLGDTLLTDNQQHTLAARSAPALLSFKYRKPDYQWRRSSPDDNLFHLEIDTTTKERQRAFTEV